SPLSWRTVPLDRSTIPFDSEWPRPRLDVDQIVRFDHGGDVAIDEFAAVIVHDPWLRVFSGLRRSLELGRDRRTVQTEQKLALDDIPAVRVDKAQQEVEPRCDPHVHDV